MSIGGTCPVEAIGCIHFCLLIKISGPGVCMPQQPQPDDVYAVFKCRVQMLKKIDG